ncbi:hypothetical protein GSI_11299 [Ganoderma sinense ZZ0214-1]|uniref:Uncharacterized protein n=1 Tax=Ganoderma sinense ZZ0214-1 TaxID=1077348 RepID=A0A2G8RYN7_9APHY|nr:hypothetical protein GSI_11299 [Ganoderma sinense ZZ0214-1]
MLVSRSLHGADSVIAHFASILKGRLPNLVFLDVWRIFEDDTWHPDVSRKPVAVNPQAKELPKPCPPLRPRFPDVLTAFGGRRITKLELVAQIMGSGLDKFAEVLAEAGASVERVF